MQSFLDLGLGATAATAQPHNFLNAQDTAWFFISIIFIDCFHYFFFTIIENSMSL